ncbi:LOW QUALITY PROTEIN: hypothetical protein OSB04_031942 [Centaurea solstitialis]|uniref:GAG-pre-integrase domain-containing protein n=1 Tax=Centaurea solstitialis TaxID=347529 RepID=A0AA38W6I3_9ASTR|nr:LOW QUALITY PROTEIN: hypothetical protein OSB04_031942 [Centaurea solstitialis]
MYNFGVINMFEGGHVAFGDNQQGGKISGKGMVSKGNMTFEDVQPVKSITSFDKKHNILFNDSECIILTPGFNVVDENMILLKTPRKDNAYCLDLEDVSSNSSLNCLFLKASSKESSLWHRRMCDMNFKTMNKLVKNNLVRGLPQKEFSCDDHYVACLKGKQHKTSYKSKEINTISSPLQLLHMDLFGLINMMSIGKKSYCLVIVDDYFRFTWPISRWCSSGVSLATFLESFLYHQRVLVGSTIGIKIYSAALIINCSNNPNRVFFLRTKDETSGLIKSFVTRIENQDNLKVKFIRSDNGTEFKNIELNNFCEEKEAVNTACYVQNRVLLVKSQGKTHYELFKKKNPFIGFFKPFGCLCTILNTKSHLGNKAFKVFNSSTRIIEKSDNVKCNENTPNLPGTGPNWLFDIDFVTPRDPKIWNLYLS